MKKIIIFFLICLPLYSQPKFNFQNYVIESLKKINNRMDRFENRLDTLNDKVDRNYKELSHRIDKLNDKVDDRFYILINIIVALFLAILGGFVSLFIFIAQRTQPIYIEATKPYKEPRAKVIPKKRKAAT